MRFAVATALAGARAAGAVRRLRDVTGVATEMKEVRMSSTLNPDEPEPQVVRQTAHTTGALGPSDSSDSGSDVQGAKRHEFDRDSELDNHALETGDEELASDSDRAGTGERAAADGDSTLDVNRDIDVDRVIDPFERSASDDDEVTQRLDDSVQAPDLDDDDPEPGRE